jgi:hypothetical protein
MMASPFADILRVAVESTPRAIGGAFAASDGEMVDYFARTDPMEWALITAHYGVLLGHVHAAFSTCHYGAAQAIMLQHRELEVIVYAVDDGYYALMAMNPPAPLAKALAVLDHAVIALREEMR